MWRPKAIEAFILFFAVTFLISGSSYAVAPTYATNTATAAGLAQGSFATIEGIKANYTSSINLIGPFFYVVLVNSAGQTVYISIVESTLMPAGQETSFFAPFSPQTPSGHYTAKAFLATNSSIPVSTVGSIPVTV